MQPKSNASLSLLLPVLVVLVLGSCKKEVSHPTLPTLPQPRMTYLNLNNRPISASTKGLSIDVTGDGQKDLFFYTQLVADPIDQVDKLQFLVSSNIGINLPVNIKEEVPVMKIGDSIAVGDFAGFRWFELSSVLLIQKIISFNAPPVWNGHWKNALHKYLPYQVVDNGKRCNGWVELSVDLADEKVVVHKAAISKAPNQGIKAGE